MKISLMKLRVIWRRFRRSSPEHNEHHLRYVAQIQALMRRANPFASWNERANWMIDLAEWLRRAPAHSRQDADVWQRVRYQRIRFLLDWLDRNRDTKRVVQTTLQKTLREAVGPELFCATGLPREPAFFSELWERVIRLALPRPPGQQDLSTLFTAMFPRAADADWLLGLEQEDLTRIWKLCADDAITHNYRQQIDEALTYLTSMIIAVGISSEFRQRLEPRMPLQATPFLALRRELEKYLLSGTYDEAALRSVRMLIAVCQAQTDRIYAHLDEYGVSVSLVYRVERMRAQLARMARLLDLRAAPPGEEGAAQVHSLLADLIDSHHHRSSVHGLVSRSFSLLARKMVERNADHGEHYIARDRTEYRAMLTAAMRGGALTALTVLVKGVLPSGGAARFFEGAFASLNYATSFLLISAVGGTLATKQPAITAPALAARMQALDTVEGLRKLLQEIAYLLRSQAAAIFGNLVAVIPTMLMISAAFIFLAGVPVMPPAKAVAAIQGLSLVGPTPLFAAFTGILLWLSSLMAGFADNWFALRNMREAIAHHRRLVHALGPARAERCAKWVESGVAGVTGNISLALLLGMSPVLAQFFGLPLDVRHVTLSTGTLTAAVSSLGWGALLTPETWLAICGVLLIGLLNVGVAFACALALALRARDVPRRLQRLVFRAVLRRFTATPWLFLFPERRDDKMPVAPEPRVEEAPSERRRTGSDR
ncbi:site-specific recombinase [Noviherbaspirillum saxi]|uniref:Preprotein translocase subunit TatB n=1 Tax=Noviherbaspirillum saxi TaxID=2320863 RepID=A0A3A3G7A6_9BURK|nr:site-specific recombinase [Noviherbaspirillum saxi]RJF98025.1 preprotein translocase subunit TatB [Noviherbaspirillum saxi]